MASEAGVVDVDPARVVQKGRLQPGPHVPRRHRARAASSTTRRSRHELAAEQPYGEWLDAGPRAPRRPARPRARRATATSRCCGARRRSATRTRSSSCSSRRWRAPAPRRSARWAPTRPIAVLSDRPRHAVRLLPAAVRAGHEPAARRDPRGARHVAVVRRSAPEGNLLEPRPESCVQIELPFPIIDNDELAKLIHIDDDGDRPEFAAHVISGLYRSPAAARALREALDRVRAEASAGDRARASASSCSPTATPTAEWAPIPSLLLTSAVHHHLIREKTRTQVGLVVEAGDAREVHHMALLSATAPARSTRTSRSSRSRTSSRSDLYGLGGIDPHEGDQELHQGRGQGRAQGDVEDGHLHRRVVPRRAGVRGDRARARSSSTSTSPARCRGSAASASTRSPRRWRRRHALAYADAARRARAPRPRPRRRVPVAPRGRVPPLQPGDGVQAAARDPRQALRRLQGVHEARRRPVDASSPRCAGCSSSREGVRAAGADRRGRAGRARS